MNLQILSFVFAALFFLSMGGVVYAVFRKVPLLAQIPEELLANRETFFAFMRRVGRAALSAFNPKRWWMHILSWLARNLNAMRIFFSRVHHTIEAIAKVAREKSQRMEWEQNWFPPREVKKRDSHPPEKR